jgi:hypothetical protein
VVSGHYLLLENQAGKVIYILNVATLEKLAKITDSFDFMEVNKSSVVMLSADTKGVLQTFRLLEGA